MGFDAIPVELDHVDLLITIDLLPNDLLRQAARVLPPPAFKAEPDSDNATADTAASFFYCATLRPSLSLS